MVNQELKLVIEGLADTADACNLKVSDDCLLTEACKFLRQSKIPTVETKESKKPIKATEAQIKYFHKFGLGDTEDLTKQEAFRKIKAHKENDNKTNSR